VLRFRAWALLAVLLLLGLALRLPVAGVPLDRDEGEYAYIAQRWLQGEVPYKSSFDQKPPGAFAAYAVLERFIGESPAALHWGTQVYSLTTVALVFFLGLELFGAGAGLAAGAFCAFLMADRSFLGQSANTEIFMIAPLTAAFLAALRARERDSWRWALACGLLSGLGLLFKQVAITNIVFYLGLLVLTRRRGLLTASFLGGMAVALIPVAAYFWFVGAWKECYDCVIGYNLRYSSDIHLAAYPAAFWKSFSPTLSSLGPIYLLALGCLSRMREPSVRLIGAWLAFSFLGVCSGGFFRSHYYMQIVPALALLAGAGAEALARPYSKARPWALPVLAGVVLAWGVMSNSWYYGAGSPEEKSRRLFGANPFPESVEVARLIAENSTKDDGVFVFGSEPQILYLARRRSASRYIFAYPLFRPYLDTAERQAEVLRQVRESSPKHIVTVFVHTSFLASIRAPLGMFSEMRRILEGYRLIGVMETGKEGRPALRTGEEARRLWEKSPMWYDKPIWGSLAVWEKKG